MKNATFPRLHHDAPQVPEGYEPREGVTYGCGNPACDACYRALAQQAPGGVKEGDDAQG